MSTFTCLYIFADRAYRTSRKRSKYLGVILGVKKLLWTDNILDRTRKASTALFACKKAIGRKRGFSPMIVHWLYTAIVSPILLYGYIVWKEEKNCNLRILHKIQRSAELCISGALRTTATEALNTILDLQPLDLLAKSWASATAMRLREAAAWTTGSTGSLQYPIKTYILTKQYRLRSTHSQLRKKRQDLHTHPYRLGQPPTPIRKRCQHIHRRLQA